MLRPLRLPTILAAVLLVTATIANIGLPTMADGSGDDVEQLRTELNETRKDLEKAEEDRDAYAQRLEDQTTILIIVLVLLSISWVIFFLTTRRTQVALKEMKRQMGVTKTEQREKRRERRRG